MLRGARPMITVWVELAGRNVALGRAEAQAASEALGGGAAPDFEEGALPGFERLELPDPEGVSALADRLSLARRCLMEIHAPPGALEEWFGSQGSQGQSASFRELRETGSEESHRILPRWVSAFKVGGGRIDLESPDRRFWIARGKDGESTALEEIGAIQRAAFQSRRMPQYPFQRPVSLDPRLARAAVNLARIRPQDRVLDPFVGTGSLLIEAALLGARVSGVDREADMIRGALQNFAHVGLVPESMIVGDSATVGASVPGARWDAMVTDPPYGRASGTQGEPVAELLARTLPVWAEHIHPGGRIVLVTAGGPDPISDPWSRVMSIPDRVHRSLTREFRVYERRGTATRP